VVGPTSQATRNPHTWVATANCYGNCQRCNRGHLGACR